MKLIDKDALVAEIERRKKSLHQVNSPREQAVLYECKDILSFIDTLEVKEVDLEKKPASEDLEQAAEECVDGEDYPYIDRDGLPLYTPDYLTYMFKQGAQWQKEQMMKDAIEGEVKTLYRHIVYVESVGIDSSSIRENKQDVFAGDKVKVIIIKE